MQSVVRAIADNNSMVKISFFDIYDVSFKISDKDLLYIEKTFVHFFAQELYIKIYRSDDDYMTFLNI